MARALSLVVGGLLVAAGIAFLAPALSGHASARAAWEAERARLGTAAYDAARSDARYLESRRHHARAGHAALLLAAHHLFVRLRGAVSGVVGGCAIYHHVVSP